MKQALRDPCPRSDVLHGHGRQVAAAVLAWSRTCRTHVVVLTDCAAFASLDQPDLLAAHVHAHLATQPHLTPRPVPAPVVAGRARCSSAPR